MANISYLNTADGTTTEYLKARGTGSDGDPRISKVPAHEKLQYNCQRHFQSEIDSSKKRIDVHDEKLDKILEGIGELKVAIGIRNKLND
jgi:hypothetical protein